MGPRATNEERIQSGSITSLWFGEVEGNIVSLVGIGSFKSIGIVHCALNELDAKKGMKSQET